MFSCINLGYNYLVTTTVMQLPERHGSMEFSSLPVKMGIASGSEECPFCWVNMDVDMDSPHRLCGECDLYHCPFCHVDQV